MPLFPRRTPGPMPADSARGGEDEPRTDISAEAPGPLWAVITGQAPGTNRYAWSEVNEGDVPTFAANLADGFFATGTAEENGTPAYEVEGRTAVPTNGTAKVRLWPGDGTYYTFRFAGIAGTGTDNHITRWDGATAIQDSGATLDDSGNLIARSLSAQSPTAGTPSAFVFSEDTGPSAGLEVFALAGATVLTYLVSGNGSHMAAAVPGSQRLYLTSTDPTGSPVPAYGVTRGPAATPTFHAGVDGTVSVGGVTLTITGGIVTGIS